jgi:hypothetical protein
MTIDGDTGQPVSWRTARYDTPVYASDGTRIGTVREVLGSDSEDIFHGLRVRLDDGGRDVMVPADFAARMTTDRIDLSAEAAELAALPDYDETASYHIGTTGWRGRLGWKRDSKSDEESGT